MGKVMPRTEVTKAIWVYIKKNKLNAGRIIKPDATLKKVLPVASLDMLKMAGYIRSTSSKRAPFPWSPNLSREREVLRPAVSAHEGFDMIAGRPVHGEPCREAECGR